MSTNGEQPPGPSHETLANLNAMMPSFIKGMEEKRARGRGIPAQIKRPRKVCPVCGLLHDHAMLSPSADIEVKSECCAPCQKELDSGQIAFVCGEDYAFGYSPRLDDWKGTVRRVSPYVMTEIKKQFNAKKRKPDADASATSTA